MQIYGTLLNLSFLQKDDLNTSQVSWVLAILICLGILIFIICMLFFIYWRRRKRGPRYVKGQESHLGSPKTPKNSRSDEVPRKPAKVKNTSRSHQTSAASTLTSSIRQPDVIAQVTSLTLPEQCPTAPVVVTRLPHPDDSRLPSSRRSAQLSQSDGVATERGAGFSAQVTPHYSSNMQHGADSVFDSSEEDGSEGFYDDNVLTFQQLPMHYHSLGSLVSNRSFHHELSVAPPLQQNQYWV